MLRTRLLTSEEYKVHPDSPKRNVIYTLLSSFDVSPDSDDLNEETCAVKIQARLIWDNDGGFFDPCLAVYPDTCSLPPLGLIQEEINYLLNFLKSFLPYETSSPSVAPDFQEV